MIARITIFMATIMCIGCVSTQKMADGSYRVKLFDRRIVNQYMANNLSQTQTNEATETDQPGVMPLLPIKNPVSGKNMLYLDGRFNYHCLAELLYMAKSNSDKPKNHAEYRGCRYDYIKLQEGKKKAGLSYDPAAPSLYDDDAIKNSYWEGVVTDTIAKLKGVDRFKIRFNKMTNTKSNGMITISPSFGMPLMHDVVHLLADPPEVPITIDDPEVMNRIKTTGETETVVCDAIWDFVRAAERTGTKSQYGKYLVFFKTTQIGCHKPKHDYSRRSFNVGSLLPISVQ